MKTEAQQIANFIKKHLWETKHLRKFLKETSSYKINNKWITKIR